jgi:hypothetical protein
MGRRGAIYVALFPRAGFIQTHRGGATDDARQFDAFVNELGSLVAGYESQGF